MEFGDGQVSGLQQLKAEEFYRIFRGQGIHNPDSIEDIKRIYKVVKREIDKCNPYGLLPEASRDEFNSESEDVARYIKYDSSVEKIAKTVSRVFSNASKSQYFTVDACMDVAVKIREALDEDQGKEAQHG